MQLIHPLILQALLLALTTTHLASATVTRQECVSQGGQVVGDIGDGAIFGPNYICENSGEPPTDVVVPGPEEPIATEGEVCCGGIPPTMISEADCEANYLRLTWVNPDGEFCSDDITGYNIYYKRTKPTNTKA